MGYDKSKMQHTLSSSVTLSGIGLHSGSETRLTIKPAPANSGIVFVRVDVTDKNNKIPAKFNAVVDTRLCTVIGNAEKVTVGTIEHLMAAMASLKIDNAIIELDAPEVPIMDGSAAPFIDAILRAGIKAQTSARRAIKILKDIEVKDGDKIARFKPSVGMVYDISIDFIHPAIGAQRAVLDLLQENFETEISRARTFGFMHEVKALRAQGLALGGSTDNAIVLDDSGILNPEGLRFEDEFARHKLLDAVGDLALAGMPFLGTFQSYKGGHALNNQLLRALMADKTAYTVVDLFSTAHSVEISADLARSEPCFTPHRLAAE